MAAVRSVHGEEALRSALADARTVINLLPLTEATRGLLDRRFFASMRPGAGLVNLGRGAHLNEADLLAALNEGRVGHAVLDVFAHEPLAEDHAFWRPLLRLTCGIDGAFNDGAGDWWIGNLPVPPQ